MPAHYKPQSHHTEHHLHPRPHTLRPDRMPSGRLDPQPRLPWSPRHQKQQYSPYAPSAFANMVGSFAESYEYLQPHLNRATSRRNPFTTKSQHYEYRNDSDTMPSYDDYQKPSSSPTNMAISTYTTRSDSGSGSSSSASATLVGRDGGGSGGGGGGNAAVWSPLREWREGACTTNRDRLVGECNTILPLLSTTPPHARKQFSKHSTNLKSSTDYCQANDLAEPMYKTYSDRRGSFS